MIRHGRAITLQLKNNVKSAEATKGQTYNMQICKTALYNMRIAKYYPFTSITIEIPEEWSVSYCALFRAGNDTAEPFFTRTEDKFSSLVQGGGGNDGFNVGNWFPCDEGSALFY